MFDYNGLTSKKMKYRQINKYYTKLAKVLSRNKKNFIEDLKRGKKIGKGDLIFGCSRCNELVEKVHYQYGCGRIGGNCLEDIHFEVASSHCGGSMSWNHCADLPRTASEIKSAQMESLLKLEERMTKRIETEQNPSLREEIERNLSLVKEELATLDQLYDEFGVPNENMRILEKKWLQEENGDNND